MNTKNKKFIFEVKNLSKKYKNKKIVDNISFYGRKSEVVGFLGANGAGKTTTIKMMTGLVRQTEGSVKICGYDLNKEFEQAISCVGAIVETPYLYENLKGIDNLKIFAKAKHVGQSQIEKMIELSGLKDRLNDYVKNYSLGMKQRLGIAVALLSNPPLLILDEPTNGLDPIAIRDLREFLKRLAHEDGTCILISSHMLWEMEKLCDRVVIINEGVFIGETMINNLSINNINLEDYYISCVEKNLKN